MMVLSGQLAGRFRTAARRCVVGRPRGPTPPIVIERTLDAVTLFCDLGEVAIGLRTAEGVGAPERVVVPGSLLEQVPTSANTELKLDVTAEGRGQVQWVVKGQAKEEHWDAVSVSAASGPWPTPRMKPIEASFLAAMHECGRAAARESVRYALSRVQLQGGAGRSLARTAGNCSCGAGFGFPSRNRF